MGEVSTEKALGVAIQKARQEARLTQQELCQLAGLSYSTLAKIERGAIKTPSVFTVASIARVLDKNIDDFLGAVVDTKSPQTKKLTSTSGVSFLYLDINGCLVRFFHGAFTRISLDTGVASDIIESTFWHYNDAVCKGEMSLEEFDRIFAEKLGVPHIDWEHYYFEAIQPITEMAELARWASRTFKIGLLSNIMPGFINKMITQGILPDIHYDAIIDSSVVGAIKPDDTVYKIAEERALVPSSQILFVDDSRTNLMAAEHRGWKVLWFDDYQPAQSVAKIKSLLEV